MCPKGHSIDNNITHTSCDEGTPQNNDNDSDVNDFLDIQVEDEEHSDNNPKNETHVETFEPVNDNISTTIPQDETATRSVRAKSLPQWFNDKIVKLPPSVNHKLPASNQGTSTTHLLSHFVSYDSFSKNHKAFLTTITSIIDPKSFKQAFQDKCW